MGKVPGLHRGQGDARLTLSGAPSWGRCARFPVGTRSGKVNPNWSPIIGKMCQVSIGDKVRLDFYLLRLVLTLIHVAKFPKGLSCFKKQTAKHFLM